MRSQRPAQVPRFPQHSQDQHLALRALLVQLGCGGQPVGAGHPDIDHGHIRMLGQGGGHDGLAVGDLGDHLDVVFQARSAASMSRRIRMSSATRTRITITPIPGLPGIGNPGRCPAGAAGSGRPLPVSCSGRHHHVQGAYLPRCEAHTGLVLQALAQPARARQGWAT